MKYPRLLLIAVYFVLVGSPSLAAEPPLGFDPTERPTLQWLPAPTDLPDSRAATETEMKPYAETLDPSGITLEMVAIPGGLFLLGSPESEDDRAEDEGPQARVRVEPFWMGRHEITWEQFDQWADIVGMKKTSPGPEEERSLYDRIADAVSRPSHPMSDITFGMGRGRDYPAFVMSQLAARCYCKWLSAKTGRFYRLPTEAEWEYACRAGTTSAYSFGDDPDRLDDYGWYFDNGNDRYHRVGLKKPNPWGLYDMHGNVSEWVLDRYDADRYTLLARGGTVTNPLAPPPARFPCVARGGCWDDDPDRLRSAARTASKPRWQEDDPRKPQSIWFNTKSWCPGFRVIRPLRIPTPEEAALYEPDYNAIREYMGLRSKKTKPAP